MQLSDLETTATKSAELDYGLRSTFLAQMDEGLKLRIFDLTTRTARELHRWAARYPLVRRVRVWPLCLSVAAAAPFASVQALVTAARMSLWVFTIDDLFDEEIVPFVELRRRVEQYKLILQGASSDAKRDRDTLASALRNIRDDLQTYPQFDVLQPYWAEATARTLDAMMREHDWRTEYRAGAGTMPSYAGYLEYGVYSIGVAAHIWTTLIAIGDPSTVAHLARLQEMAQRASLCIRLANDLQSYSKEIAEGKINSIVLRQHEAMASGETPEAALRIACAKARQDIVQGLGDCAELQHQDQTMTGEPEQAIGDIARFVCDFYVHHDYHTFAAGTGKM